MHEQPSDESLAPKQQLIALLQTDFTPEGEPEAAPDPDDALASLLSHVISTEDIDARLLSDESVQLGQTARELLAAAPVTEAFKGYITDEIRQAHAWQSRVPDAVAPDRLGLVSSEGIFDPAQAERLEGAAVRGYLFDLISEYTAALTADGQTPEQLVLRPGVRPRDYTDAVDRLDSWLAEYQAQYGKHALEGVDADAFIEASPKVDDDLASSAGFTQLVEGLAKLRDKGGPNRPPADRP